MFRRVLVANRGEIACRVLRTCERLGIETVAVFSDADIQAPHVALADQALRLGGPRVQDSYLDIDALCAAITQTGADAVHPGYGLLSENPEFSRAVAATGAVFIGPSPDVLRQLGDKLEARALARSVGVEPPPGSAAAIDPNDAEALRAAALQVGFPVLLKAAAGGGGIGMQIATSEPELGPAAKKSADRGRAAFGDARVYLERYLDSPRHIEVQVFRDQQGNATALGERDCSVQRRHQKIIEESASPAAFLRGEPGERVRAELQQRALRVIEAVDYVGAGTVEFVCDASGHAFFLEVNARLQVEHPVTELRCGLDLVELQLRVAAGEALPEAALRPRLTGHAVEARVYAEDPDKGFLPQPGKLEHVSFPEPSDTLRIDSGIVQGYEITPYYDPLLCKVIAFGDDRKQAITRLAEALTATRIELLGPKGPRKTNLEFLVRVLRSEPFASGDYDTGLVERLMRTQAPHQD